MANVDDVFAELRRRGLIVHALRIKPDSRYPNFKMGRKKILYNPRFANLPHELLRFILLHEDAHRCRRQNSHLVFWLTTTTMIACLAIALWEAYPDYEHMRLVLVCIPSPYLMFFFVMYRIFEVPVQEDEYEADFQAASTLKKEFSVQAPSDVAKEALESLRYDDTRCPLVRQVIHLLFGGMHPSDNDRVRCIGSTVDGP